MFLHNAFLISPFLKIVACLLQGDTLIHSIASQGDSHEETLAELLALRTIQGNRLFDLSKRNYDG